MSDGLEELLGIDMSDPIQRLAHELVDSDCKLIDRLVELRNARGLTRAEVAERMGTTEDGVALFEGACSDPKLSTIRRYALSIGAVVFHRSWLRCQHAEDDETCECV